MNKPKIALAMIVKGIDEELGMLKRCLKSIQPFVDAVYITFNYPDRKKIEKTWDWCKNNKIKCSYETWGEDFARARNFNFKQVPKEYPWILWLDIDDVFRNGKNLRKAVEIAERTQAGSVFFNYLYQVEVEKIESGFKVKNVLIEHLRERLVRNGLFDWVAPIHETLISKSKTRNIDLDICDVVHLSDDERRIGAIKRNVKILEKNVEDTEHKDPRPVYYLAKAYFDIQTPESLPKAEKLLFEYLEGDHKSGWAQERNQAWEYLAEIYRIYGQYNKSIKACLNALVEYPKFPSTYFSIALQHVLKKQWDYALHWVKIGTSLPMPKTTLVHNPLGLATRALEVIYHACLNLGMTEEAWAAAKKISELKPKDENLQNRFLFMQGKRQRKEAKKIVLNLVKYLKGIGEEDKIPHVIDGLPSTISNDPKIHGLFKQFLKPRQWLKNEIAIYCGRGFAQWSPKSMIEGGDDTFLGGSEEAVVYLSEELAKLGWKVTVYANPGEDVGIVNGVNWQPYFKYNDKDWFNVLISWRNPAMFKNRPKAQQKYLWAHDVLNPADFTENIVNQLDKLIVLSKAHRKTIPNVPDHKILLSTNGFFEHLPKQEIKNDPKKIIWTSSYDRGLQHLLEMWPEVVKEVPDAELHVFYGWKLFEQFYRDNPERMDWMAKMNKMMEHKGITHHGRVTQPEIEKWHKKCGIWAYPTHFYEINCITAIKAQLWGNTPVVVNYAALEETVQHGVKVSGDIYDKEIKEEFTRELINLLKNPQSDEDRKKMMKWSRDKYHWNKVASQWSQEFLEDERVKKAVNVLINHDNKLIKYLPVEIQRNYGHKICS